MTSFPPSDITTDSKTKQTQCIQEKDITSIIYKITRKDDEKKVYVGLTRSHIFQHGKYRPHGAAKRWKQHVGCAMRNGPTCGSPDFYEDIRNLGENAFDLVVLEECLFTKGPLREIWHIHNENAMQGYNCKDVAYKLCRNSTKGIIMQAKEAVRKETFEEVKITKAILMVIEGCAPKVSVFFETDDAKTSREMKRTTFSASASMEDAKARAEEFAKQHTPNFEYCTGRTKKTETTEKWLALHKDTPFVCLHIRGPKSRGKKLKVQYIQVLAQTEKAKTVRAMKKCEFFITSTVEEAKTQAIEFAKQFQVKIEDGVGQEKSTKRIVPKEKKITAPKVTKKRKHSEIDTQ
jgi:hypothetical protein